MSKKHPVPVPPEHGPYDFRVLRELRQRAGLTQQEIAEQSGLSTAVLSKLERNQNLCELNTLHRLARVFGLSASDLLSLCESTTSHRKSAEHYESRGVEFDRISFQGISLFYTAPKVGQSHSKPEAHGDDYEICWLIKGRLRLTLPNEAHELTPGQALQFDAALPHTYEILEDAEIFIIHLTKEHRF